MDLELHPLITRAHEELVNSSLSKSEKKEIVAIARVLLSDCDKKDPEVIATALLSPFQDYDRIAKDYSKRVSDMLQATCAVKEGEELIAIRGLNSPFAAEAKVLQMASVIPVLESVLPDARMAFNFVAYADGFEKIIKTPNLPALPHLPVTPDEVNKELQEGAKEAREVLTGIRGFLAELKPFTPLLGTTGEARLEQHFVKSYNNLATLVGETAINPPASKTSKPAAPKGPAP